MQVMTTPILDPKYPLRLGWVEADQGHGAWIEIADAKTVPPYDKDWDLARSTAPPFLFGNWGRSPVFVRQKTGERPQFPIGLSLKGGLL